MPVTNEQSERQKDVQRLTRNDDRLRGKRQRIRTVNCELDIRR
jgi:hypothetical protein